MQTKDKGIIKSFHYNQLMVVETHPTAIVLEVISMTPNLRFKTLQGFEIVRLFEIYKGLWESAAKV